MEKAIDKHTRDDFAWLYNRFKCVEGTALVTYSASIIADYTQLMDDLNQEREMYDCVAQFEDYLIVDSGIEIIYLCIFIKRQ
jgi:hypothetical protein